MKRIFYSVIMSSLILGLAGCYKTCEDPFAPNYTLNGSCIDLTSSIVGTYNGQLTDSIVGLHSTTAAATIQITKVDDSHVQVNASGTTSFIGFNASVAASGGGYYLTVPSQTSSNGLALSGAGTYFGSAADGIYVNAGKQLTIAALSGTQYENFTGTQQ